MNEIQVVRTISGLKDIERLIVLISEQMKSIGSEKDYVHLRAAVENALSDSNRSLFFLYLNKGDIVAFTFGNICAGLESGADYLWINELYVSNGFRNKGIASELLSFIEDWSEKESIKYMACITGLKNHSAMKLYEKNGFEINQTNWVDKTIIKNA